jgi:phenylalanyl-tRNA synthetase beta chain
VLGEPIADAVVDGILNNLGFGIKNTASSFEIEVPAFRFKDIAIEADIIEEVIRIYGLSNIKAELPVIQMTQAHPAPGFALEQAIKNTLANTAYENINFSFLGEKLLKRAGVSPNDLIEVANPISEDLQFMRPSLLPYLLEKVEANKLEQEVFALFEMGRVFGKTVVGREKKQVAYMAYNSDFLSIKGILEELFETLGLTVRIQPTPKAPSYAHPGQVAEINFQGKCIGFIGTLHPSLAKNFHINKPCALFEMELESILSASRKAPQYKEFNRLPKAERDQNFILDKTVLAGDFVRKISKASPLLVDIKVVDVYEGEHIEKGLKSLTIRAIYQSPEKTLTDAEVDAMHKQLVELAQKNGAQLRG